MGFGSEIRIPRTRGSAICVGETRISEGKSGIVGGRIPTSDQVKKGRASGCLELLTKMENICETPTKVATGEVASPTDDEVATLAFQTPLRANDATITTSAQFMSISGPKMTKNLATSSSSTPSIDADVADVCPICLEELHCDRDECASSSSAEPDFIETRCKHVFHKKCLLAAKLQHKSECPCCRNLLTPPPTSAFLNLDTANGPIAHDQGLSVVSGQYTSYITGAQYPSSMAGMQAVSRHAIIAASSRGREAVRRSLQQRYQHQQQHQQQ